MGRKILALLCTVAIVLTLSGCSLKVNDDTIYIPREKVLSAEIQKEYKKGEKDSYYCKKEIKDSADLDKICTLVRKLPAVKASSEHPNPIEEASIIVVLHGKKDHQLILNEKMAFYDQVAYEYTDKDAYEHFLEFYDELDCDEVKTEPDYF